MNSLIQSQPEKKCYPIRTLRVFGGIQIGIGILSGLLSVAEIVLDVITLNKDCYWDDSYYYYQRCAEYEDSSIMLPFDITCLLFSGWFILTGVFPFCMTENRRSSWRCLKITFMILCIVGSSIFVPTVFSLGILGAIVRANDSGGLAVLPSFVAFLGLVELVTAIVAASYCCCCSTWARTRHTRLVYATAPQYGAIMSIPTTEVPTFDSLRNSQTTFYPSTTQNIEAGTQQPPTYKQ